MPEKKSNPLNSTSIDDTTAVINDVNKTGKMITFEFDPVQMGTGEANITEKIVMYDGDHFMRKFLEIDSEDKDVRMDYIDGEHLIRHGLFRRESAVL